MRKKKWRCISNTARVRIEEVERERIRMDLQSKKFHLQECIINRT